MARPNKLEMIGLIFTFVFSFVFFYKDTFMFFDCLAAASIATLLTAASYIVLKWLVLAFR